MSVSAAQQHNNNNDSSDKNEINENVNQDENDNGEEEDNDNGSSYTLGSQDSSDEDVDDSDSAERYTPRPVHNDDPEFYNPEDSGVPFKLNHITLHPDSLSRKRVRLMRSHYQNLDTGADKIHDLKMKFNLHFATALRERERWIRVLDLAWNDFSVPLTSDLPSGTVGTWSSYLLNKNSLIGLPLRMVKWLKDRDIGSVISLHATDLQPSIDCEAAAAASSLNASYSYNRGNVVQSYQPNTEITVSIMSKLLNETRVPREHSRLGTWVPLVGGDSTRVIAILFARVY